MAVGAFVGCTHEEQNSSPPSPPNSSGSYQTMDYGPIIAESIRLNDPDSSLVRKGLAIRLDHDAAMIFDTDLMRFAGGVEGGWLDISETDYTSYKGSGTAQIEGRQIFGSPEIAGWAKGGRFDPQREDGMGNLPEKWAHYKGYYRHDGQVVLSYSVGGTDVLEVPEAIKHNESVGLVRNIRVENTENTLQALIMKKRPSWSVEQATDSEIIFGTGDSALAVTLVNAPVGVRLAEEKKNQSGLIKLYVPPSEDSQTIRIMLFEMSSPTDNLIQELPHAAAHNDIPDFNRMVQGGPTQWGEVIPTSGELSDDQSGYVIDRIGIPFDNPWGSWMRLSGIDFFDGGQRAAVSTWNGDVWIVSGIDKTLEDIRWRRFASGLFYPMGVAVVDGDIYVTERSQLTRLRDLNGDGEADYYENFNNDGIVYPRALTQGLAVDSKGYFYFFKNGNRVPSNIPQHGALIRVSPDGATREVYAQGFRSANTLGIGPDDNILTVDQEGQWVPMDRINVIKGKGGFYGYRPHGGKDLKVGEFKVPVAWIPHSIEPSAGFVIYVGDSRWGPLAGHWIMSSYGKDTLFEVLMEKMGGRFQGGVVRVPGIRSQAGIMRASVNAGDGQLYTVGLRGWGTIATANGSFSRIRYTGSNVNLPQKLHVTPRGVKIVFTNSVDATSAQNIQNYTVERWEYLYSKYYGSPEISLAHPLQKGRDTIAVSSATVGEDARTVLLKIPDMQSVMQMGITYNLKFKNGQKATNTIYHTINWLTETNTVNQPAWQQRIISGIRDSLIQEESFNLGRRLIMENECKSCHVVRGESFGPSFQSIAQRYAQNKQTIDQLSAKIIHGGSGKWGARVMPPHPNIMKADVEKMVKYILSCREMNDK